MPCVTVTIFILQVEMQRVYMMYRLLNKTYCVGMLANGRIEAVEVEKIVNQDVVQALDTKPYIKSTSKGTHHNLKIKNKNKKKHHKTRNFIYVITCPDVSFQQRVTQQVFSIQEINYVKYLLVYTDETTNYMCMFITAYVC